MNMKIRPQVSIITILLIFSSVSGLVLANDAGTGADAGNSASTASNLNAVDAIYYGNLSANDTDDYYSISIPNNRGISVDLTSPTGSDFDLYLYDQNQSWIDTSVSTGALDSVTSNGTAIGGTTVYVRAKLYSGSGQYTMQIWILNNNNNPCNTNQNDANTGGDASNTQSSGLSLNSINGTYYGCSDNSSDEYDWYSISIPNYHSITAELMWNNTNVDLDLHLFDSNGTYLDYSYDYNPENISSGSADIGGTTVTLLVRAFTGGDNYTLMIYFDNISNSQVYNQNDANSGGDVSGDFSSAYNINGNSSYLGWISDSGDVNDIYSISIPEQFGLEATLSWNGSGIDFDFGLFDQYENLISSSFYANPEFVESGATNVSNTTIFLVVQAGNGEGNYSINLTLINQSSILAFNQNDAYSGADAGGDFTNSTNINASNGTTFWPGYLDDTGDEYDFYAVFVPTDYAISATLGYPSNNAFALGIYENNNNQIDYSLNGQSPESVSTNGTGIYVGNSMVFVEIWAYYGSGEYNLTLSIFSLDLDGDGYYDEIEINCGSDSNDFSSTPLDTDADGICDILDEDDDNDGIDDSNDSFPTDPNESSDIDGDSIGDNSDLDDDGDGWSDLDESECNSDQLDYSDMPLDTDSDLICDIVDEDDDNDNYLDSDDAFPLNEDEWIDTDYDGIGNNEDDDDDNDGYNDQLEDDCLSDPLTTTSVPIDTDDDGICDELDEDIDGDGTPNDIDSSPLDSTESIDTDGDGIGDNADTDDDNDGYSDSIDVFPLDQYEWFDFDGDSVGDNSDLDDDGDGWSDLDESVCLSGQFDTTSQPLDFDDDHICDIQDLDDDGDGILDDFDPFPLDSLEWSDLDDDGIGDRADIDDDGDSWEDLVEPNCGADPEDFNSFPADFDLDHICDILDLDDDNDMVMDLEDAFPMNPKESNDIDGDGIGDNSDTDADGDNWPNSAEIICNSDLFDPISVPDDYDGDWSCDLIDPDDDNDLYPDIDDLFPLNSDEWEDLNKDGLGDNKYPLSIFDKVKLNSNVLIPISIMIIVILSILLMILTKKQYSEEPLLEYEDIEKIENDDSSEIQSEKSLLADDDDDDDDDEGGANLMIISDETNKLEKFDEYPGWLWDSSEEKWIPEE